MTKILGGKFEKNFLEGEKMAPRKDLPALPPHEFFHVYKLSIGNHTVLLLQFRINLLLWVFQNAEIALAEAARAISDFCKTHLCKLVPNWTRNRIITYMN